MKIAIKTLMSRTTIGPGEDGPAEIALFVRISKRSIRSALESAAIVVVVDGGDGGRRWTANTEIWPTSFGTDKIVFIHSLMVFGAGSAFAHRLNWPMHFGAAHITQTHS